jgi:hypothetical protein
LLEQALLDPKLESTEGLVWTEQLHPRDLLQPIVRAVIDNDVARPEPCHQWVILL